MADSLLTNIWISGWKPAFIDQITDTFILVLKTNVLWILILQKEHWYTFNIYVDKFTSERQFTHFAIATANVGQTIYKRSQECLLLNVVV